MSKKLFLVSALTLCLGLGVSTANAEGIAVVDVAQVVNASAQVQALKKEQQTQAQEIVKFVEKARKDVASITDASKKKAAEEKYNKELISKKEKMDKAYAQKLQTIDNSISKQITDKAKADGYDVVLTKGVVLYGGKDITQELVKIIK